MGMSHTFFFRVKHVRISEKICRGLKGPTRQLYRISFFFSFFFLCWFGSLNVKSRNGLNKVVMCVARLWIKNENN